MLAILAPQWQGGNTSPCYCEAGIPSLGVPPVKITPNRVKYSKLHSRWCNFPSSDASCPPQGTTLLPAPTRLPPLPKTPPDTPCAYDHFGGVCFAVPPLRAPTKNSTIFRIVVRRSIPNHDSHFPSFEQRARFDGEVGYVVTYAYLLRRHVATRGRGCRPQRVDFRRKQSTRAVTSCQLHSLPQRTNTHPWRSVTAKIEYCVKSILRMCLYIKSILHEIVTM